MLYVHTIGRIGKDSQVITGTHGSFIAFDIAVEDSASLWKDKDGNHQIQLSIAADTLEFINTGKREGTASDTADTTDTAGEVPEPPADAPQDDKDDLPF